MIHYKMILKLTVTAILLLSIYYLGYTRASTSQQLRYEKLLTEQLTAFQLQTIQADKIQASLITRTELIKDSYDSLQQELKNLPTNECLDGTIPDDLLRLLHN